MGLMIRLCFIFTLTIFSILENAYCLIGPVRNLPSGNVLLVPSEEIRLSEEHIELYHHPLGIWLVEYRALLKNLYSQEINRTVGFPSGFDIRVIEGELYCDRFENFKVFLNDQVVQDVNFMIKCSNYVETTGTEWNAADNSGIGFLNTWDIKFNPDQANWIKVTFSFIVKKAPSIYNSELKDVWYVDLVNWLKRDYAMREEHNFQLPINIGSFWAFYPDSIMTRTYIAAEWLTVVDKSQRKYEPAWIKKYEFCEPVGFYSPPIVVLDTLAVDQIQSMSVTKQILLKNSFFAKYGKPFENELLKKFFSAQPWYRENAKFDNWYLTQWDIENIKRIKEWGEN